jgi:hypothetical protein
MKFPVSDFESNVYQVIHPVKKKSCRGHRYMAFRITDGEQTYVAHAWEGQYFGPVSLEHGQTMHITGKWVCFNGISLLRCKTIAGTRAQPLAWKKARMRVRVMMLVMSCRPMKTFVQEVFSDRKLLESFMRIPASRHHHHAYPGGLFIHSVDAAWEVFRNSSLPKRDRDIAMTAALLHDVGKVVTHDPEGKLADMGRHVDHDALTLSVLDSPLRHLDKYDKEAALFLRHYLTWNPRKHAIPRSMGAAYVRVADMASVASGLR